LTRLYLALPPSYILDGEQENLCTVSETDLSCKSNYLQTMDRFGRIGKQESDCLEEEDDEITPYSGLGESDCGKPLCGSAAGAVPGEVP